MNESALEKALAELRSPETVRTRCRNILATGLVVGLPHFAIDLARLPAVAQRTANVTRKRYPDLQIPPHSRFAHFDAGGVDRLTPLLAAIAHLPESERARTLIDVAVTSVLLDAGAGMAYRYHEPGTSHVFSRSEALAVASLHLLSAGSLSSREEPYHVDADGLRGLSRDAFEAAFQVTEHNPLVGVDGRLHLLRSLGDALTVRRDIFGERARPGGLLDWCTARATQGRLSAASVLEGVLLGFGGIWPSRLRLQERPLGDVFEHPAAGGEGLTRGYVPFHKLSQWLTYSLLLPLELAGLKVVGIEALTGLAEYRNGGLFLDCGVLVPKHPGVLGQIHEVSSQVVVEWRALTVALLDELLPMVQKELGVPLSLAAMLEGGTWAAGRELAKELREDGGSPLRVRSDATVF